MFTEFSRAWAVAAAVLCLAAIGRAADTATNDPPRHDAEVRTARGAFPAAFSQGSPLSAMAEVSRRFRSRLLEDTDRYDITNETFMVRVPTNVEASSSWGLMVFVDPNGRGDMPPAWADVLDRHRLLWIAPKGAGNEREFLSRMRLAVDAAFNMRRQYTLDADRLYVAGVSGGGRVASVTALLYPDLFRGGYYMVGCDYFRPIPSEAQPNACYRAIFNEPPAKLLELAKEKGRYVLLTGETDGNRDQTIGNYRHGYQKDGFRHVTYIEVPKMGHASPDAAWFEKGLAFLDGQTNSPAAAAVSPGPTPRSP